MHSKVSRRDIIKQGSIIVSGVSVLGLTACTGDKGKSAATTSANTTAPEVAKDTNPLISEDHPTAKGIKYVADASTVDASTRVEKSGMAGKDQLCSNCVFYKPVAGKEYGACQLIPVQGKNVVANGWCPTWSKKS